MTRIDTIYLTNGKKLTVESEFSQITDGYLQIDTGDSVVFNPDIFLTEIEAYDTIIIPLSEIQMIGSKENDEEDDEDEESDEEEPKPKRKGLFS